MKLKNDEVINVFWKGTHQEACSHSKNLRCENNRLFSYQDEIARVLEDGSILVCSQDDAKSATTSAHVNKLVMKYSSSNQQGMRISYAQLDTWSIALDDIKSAKELPHLERTFQLSDGRWLYSPPYVERPLIKTFRLVHHRGRERPYNAALNTWFLLDREPYSSVHVARSLLPDNLWEKARKFGAVLVDGYVFIVRDDLANHPTRYSFSAEIRLPIADHFLIAKTSPEPLKDGSLVESPYLARPNGRSSMTADRSHWSGQVFEFWHTKVAPIPRDVSLLPDRPTLELLDWT